MAPPSRPPRPVPSRVGERLIVALDVPTVGAARALVDQLNGIVSVFKLGPWLMLAPGFEAFLDELVTDGRQIFLDTKIFDIGETVREGVRRAAERRVGFLTVHGDGPIVRAAIAGKAGTDLKILAITVLTSLDDGGLHDLGYRCPVGELISERAAVCIALGCDGVIASPQDVAAIRRLPGAERLLVVTPGVRLAGTARDDHGRFGTPAEAIAAGADYLVVGRPILRTGNPAAMAARIIAEMESAV